MSRYHKRVKRTAEESVEEDGRPTTEKKRRFFNERWRISHSGQHRDWLVYEQTSQTMFCSVCRQYASDAPGRRNTFVTGSKNLKLEAVQEHESSKRHRHVLEMAMGNSAPEDTKETRELLSLKTFFTHQEMDDKTESSSERILLEPYKYLLQLPGKQVRTKLSQAFNHWLNVPEDKLQVIIEVTEMLHNASLLIDDIEDSSTLRRGFPVAHSIYGVPSVINSANYVYFLGLEKVLTLEHPEAVQVFTRQLLELHRGQGLDIHWRDTYTCPSEQEYRAMVLQKTGGLFGLAVGLMQLFSDWGHDLKPLLNTLGLFFQIRDDYANLRSREYSENKSFCEDLTEGKFSFPTIHAIWSRPESTQVQNILRQRTDNADIKRYCVDYLEKVGSFAYTRQTLHSLEEDTCRLIEELGGNPELESLVRHLGKMHQEVEAEAEAGGSEPLPGQTH